MLNIGDIVILNNNKQYAIANITNYENTDYFYVANMNDENDNKICEFIKDNLVEVRDEKLLKILEEMLSLINN